MSSTTNPFALGSFGFALGAALLLAVPSIVEAAPAKCGPVDAAKELQALMTSADMAAFRAAIKAAGEESKKPRGGMFGGNSRPAGPVMETFRTPDGSMTAKEYFEQFPTAASHMSEKRYTAACRMYEAMGEQLKTD